jgi:hypothetical protein
MAIRNWIVLFFLAIIVFSHKGFSDEIGDLELDPKEEISFTHQEVDETLQRSKETRKEVSSPRRGIASKEEADPELGAFLNKMTE